MEPLQREHLTAAVCSEDKNTFHCALALPSPSADACFEPTPGSGSLCEAVRVRLLGSLPSPGSCISQAVDEDSADPLRFESPQPALD